MIFEFSNSLCSLFCSSHEPALLLTPIFFLFFVLPLFFAVLCFLLQIGVILRDSNGIAQVRAITGSKILRVLKANGKSSPFKTAPTFLETNYFELVKNIRAELAVQGLYYL